MKGVLLVLALVSAVLVPGTGAGASQTVGGPGGYVTIDAGRATVGNALVARTITWDAGGVFTTSLVDARTGAERLEAPTPLFTYTLGPITIDSSAWTVAARSGEVTSAGGAVLRLRMTNAAWPITVIREIEVLPGVAGFASRTTLQSPVPFPLDSYTLDEVSLAGDGLVAHGVDMRGGADWRDSLDYKADVDPNGAGATAEWMDVSAPDASGIAFVMERRNYFSSVMRFQGNTAAALVDTKRDLQYTGPIESPLGSGSVGPNTTGVARYFRWVGSNLSLERAFLAIGSDRDDIPWQTYRYLRSRMSWDLPTLDFNTDGVDQQVLTPGSKDDADAPTVAELAPLAQRLGVETFVLDDGWMPYNGDWVPDPDRFPAGFEPVVDDLHQRGMRLGLWMAPGNYHPNSQTFRQNPSWSCTPVGTATGAANLALTGEQNGSAEPGIGFWNMLGRNPTGEVYADRLRSDMQRLISRYGVAKFKFDFLMWLDCASPDPVDVYQYHDSFFDRVIDPLAAEHPGVGFGLDETNDYRGFPYESILRGPVWFQNGDPTPGQALHNVWTLAPYVPGWSLGQNVLSTGKVCAWPIPTLVAAGMLYQPTIRSDIRAYPATCPIDTVASQARPWIDLYKSIRPALATMTYPLLADPITDGWTALQPWNKDAASGYVFVFNQHAASPETDVPLRGIDASRTYAVSDVTPDGETSLGTFDGATLASTGLRVRIDRADGFRILHVHAV